MTTDLLEGPTGSHLKSEAEVGGDNASSHSQSRTGWTLALVSAALFMTTLDNLVVTTALPSLRVDLHANLGDLEWTVNAYTLIFAVLLVTGAALGDRFGRRRLFVIGLGIFTAASAAAALSPNLEALIFARAAQGAGAAILVPLTLTLISEAFPRGRRGVALGLWSGISGLGVALGPVVGGAVVQGISWHWIFWLNVPVGLIIIPLAMRYLTESYGEGGRRFDLTGLLLVSVGLFGIVFGLVQSTELGWTSPTVLISLAVGILVLVGFVFWELRVIDPMIPLRFFKSRSFSATNIVSLSMYFGMFGAIFLLAQFFQTAQDYSPLEAGIRTLPWTVMPIFISPLAGVLSDRIGSRPLMFVGLAMQALALSLIANVASPTVAYDELLLPFMLGGAGMSFVFAPAANAVLSSIRTEEAGKASGTTNAIREVGGVLGIAVLASVFSATGSYATPTLYVDGLTPALLVGAGVLALGALAALAVPREAKRN